MPEHTLTLLHISDLHFKTSDKSEWRRQRVLGEAWDRNIDSLLKDGRFDLVCFTGDVAFAGKSVEYDRATSFFDELLKRLGLGLERLFVIPGNHDIDRDTCRSAWERLRANLPQADKVRVAKWLAGGAPPLGFEDSDREQILSRQSAYRHWVRESIHRPELDPSKSAHGHLGYRARLLLPHLPFAVHVLGLDSAWACGDTHDAGKLWLTDEQVMRLGSDSEGHALDGLRLGLVHHPLAELADASIARRLLAERVDLLLRGHLHETEPQAWLDPERSLHQVAAGCLYEDDHYRNACVSLRLTLDDCGRLIRCEAHFRGWSSKGHWFDDDGLYSGSEKGRLTLWDRDLPAVSSVASRQREEASDSQKPGLTIEGENSWDSSQPVIQVTLKPEKQTRIVVAMVIVMLLGIGLAVWVALSSRGYLGRSGVPLAPIAYHSPEQKVSAEPVTPTPVNPVGLREYYETIIRLDGRFLEKKEFLDHLAGSRVTWDGYVNSVADFGDGKVVLSIRALRKSQFFGQDFWTAMIIFDENWRTKLYSLRGSDKVRVVGVVQPGGVGPTLTGLSVVLLLPEKPRGSG